jgi:hypothetical protein
VSIEGGHWLIKPWNHYLWRRLNGRERRKHQQELLVADEVQPQSTFPSSHDHPESTFSHIVGRVERFLYTAALLVGGKEFIGVWLAVKVVARWQTNSGDEKPIDSDNVWLIGTGLSVFFGFLGAFVACKGNNPLLAPALKVIKW